MIRRDRDASEVFEIFAEQAEASKLMELAPDYVLPEGMFEQAGSKQAMLDIPMAVLAADKQHKLYGLTGETG